MVCGEHDGNGYYEVLQLCKATTKYIIKNIKVNNRYLNHKTWYVHGLELPLLFKRAKDTGNHLELDYSQLPKSIQNKVETVLKSKKIQPVIQDDFSVLYLTNSAPGFIIEVVYKALVKKHHPDVGGDQESFMKIKAAYDRIKKLK